MRKRLFAALGIALMLSGTCVMAEETEALTETAEEMDAEAEEEAEEAESETGEEAEAEERDYDPESGTGWMVVLINGEEEELAYTGSVTSMTGTVYSFESDDFAVTLMLNKKLEIGEEMETNAITQIEVVSSEEASVGYYFVKKSSGTDVESTVTLIESTEEGLLHGEFTVIVPTSERYVGDNKPGILEELEFTEGEFCFCE